MPSFVYRKVRRGRQLGVGFIVGLSSFHALYAQAQSLGTWNIANFRYLFSERISVFCEGQIRSWGFYDAFYYYEYKGGISYALPPKFTVSLASGRYVTFAGQDNFALPKSNDEFRLWVQALAPSVWQHWVWEHRLRAEARFTSTGFRDRFRYRLQAKLPLGLVGKSFRRFSLNFGPEVFLSTRKPHFQRLRLGITVGYAVTSFFKVYSGFLHQIDFLANGRFAHSYLQPISVAEAERVLEQIAPAESVPD